MFRCSGKFHSVAWYMATHFEYMIVKLKTLCSFETSVAIYRSKWCNIPDPTLPLFKFLVNAAGV
jgi:hypothetical protein